jgi:hypothetical protein
MTGKNTDWTQKFESVGGAHGAFYKSNASRSFRYEIWYDCMIDR